MTGMAVVMAASGIVPKALQRKPNDVFVVLWTGRDLGIPVTTALRSIHVIEGTPSLSPKLRIARVRMLGLGAIVPDPVTDTDRRVAATALAITNQPCHLCRGIGYMPSPGGTTSCERCRTTGKVVVGSYTYTWAMAAEAGMVRAACLPSAHTCRGDNRCKKNWTTYPDRMLWWRAAGYLCDDLFPEAGMGLYSPDELGAVTDEDGEVITVETVDVPSGLGPNPGPAGPVIDLASEEVRAELATRVVALPPEVQDRLRAEWKAKGTDWITPLTRLEARHVAKAIALIDQAYGWAKEAGWEPPEAPEGVSPPESPPETSTDAPEGTREPAGDAPEGAEPEATTETADPPNPQLGAAAPVLMPAHAETAIATVKAMTPRTVGDRLRKLGMEVQGKTEADRRRTLATAIARDLAAAEWTEANTSEAVGTPDAAE
jgi:hypothetical protein